VTGPVVNSGGTVKPGASSVDGVIGTRNSVGTYTQGTEGTLDVEIGLDGNDRLAVTGSASVAGKLVIRFVDDFQPRIGQSFTILTASSLSGIFNCVASDPLAEGALQVTYSPTAITVSVATGSSNPADLTGDGVVDSLDLSLLLGGWGGGCTTICCPGDINSDGVVDAVDLAILLGAWGG